MAKYGDVISAADFNNLKSVVDKEIERRSQPNSNGTMKNYTTSQYQYNDKPALGVPIKDEHIYKITIPLDAVNNGSITPQNGGYINAAYIINATTVANNLASKDAMQTVPDYVTVTAIPSVVEVVLVTVVALVPEVVLVVARALAKVTVVVIVRALAKVCVMMGVLGTVAVVAKEPVICHALEKR